MLEGVERYRVGPDFGRHEWRRRGLLDLVSDARKVVIDCHARPLRWIACVVVWFVVFSAAKWLGLW